MSIYLFQLPRYPQPCATCGETVDDGLGDTETGQQWHGDCAPQVIWDRMREAVRAWLPNLTDE